MDKKYAIFDMDGTLIDSMRYWKDLGRAYLTAKGVTVDLTALMERIKPMTMTESAALFRELFDLPGTPQAIADEMNAMMERYYREDIPLKAGVREYLEALQARGVRMCVASATDSALMEACLTRLDAAQYFEFLLSCEAVGAGKSRPDVYFEAARRLGAVPAETAVYEDALYAAQTAKRAGFYVVGVYDDAGAAHWDDLAALADETVRDWTKTE